MDQDTFAAIVASVRVFIRNEVVPLEQRIEAEDAIPDAVRDTCKEMGLYGFAIPEAYGGIGLSMAEEVELVFELGYTTPALRSMVGTNNGIAGHVLLEGRLGGTEGGVAAAAGPRRGDRGVRAHRAGVGVRCGVVADDRRS